MSATPDHLLLLSGFALFGAFAGVAHFSALKWNVRLLVVGGSPLLAAFLSVLRLSATLAAFAFAVWWGADTLLAAALGFLAARFGMVRRFTTVRKAETWA